LSAGGATGIGNVGFPVTSDATTMSFTDTNAGANIFAKSTNAAGVTVNTLIGGNGVTLTATGPVTLKGDVKGQSIAITSGGGITIQDTMGDSTTNTVTLTSTGTGNITTTSTNKPVTGQTLTVSSVGGSISGKLTTQDFDTASANLSFNTNGKGVVNVTNTTKSTVTLGSSSSGLDFKFTSNGPLNIGSISTVAGMGANDGNITVIAKSGTLVVANGSTINALGGSIVLQNSDVKAGFIIIGTNSSVKASSTVAGVGNVTINIGPTATKVVGTTPTNVTPNETKGGKIYYGKNGITALSPTNMLNALDRNIIFDTDGSSGTIQLGGGVTIQADPPEGFANTVSLQQVSNLVSTTQIGSVPVPVSLTVPAPTVQTPAITFVGQPNTNTQRLQAELIALQPTSTLSSTIALQTQTQNVFGAPRTNANYSRPISADIFTDRSKILDSNSLVMPRKHQAVLRTKFGTVTVAPGAVALVLCDAYSLSVFNFDDNKKQSVVIESGGESISLAPASHVTISNHQAANFADFAPSERIGHRNLRRCGLKDGSVAFHTQFHLVSAMVNVDSLLRLVNSSRAEDKASARHLLKTAAIVTHLQSGGEPFVVYRRPQMLSLLP